jgi:transcription elongation factor S-II
VGKLRTHDDKKVADLAKETVKKWKNDVAGAKSVPPTATGQTAGSPQKNAPTTNTTTTSSAIINGTKVENISPQPLTANKVRDASSDGIPKTFTNDKARDGSITLLYNAICLDSSECLYSLDPRLMFSSYLPPCLCY